MTFEIYTSIIILAWGICTTAYGIYLSRQNNEKYNKRIVELLEEIKNDNKQ